MLNHHIAALWKDDKRVGKTWGLLERMNHPNPYKCNPSTFMSNLLNEMQVVVPTNRSIRGKMFEWGFETLLRSHNVTYESQCDFDIRAVQLDFYVKKIVQGEQRHFLISLKTSLRERWRQAELEARILKPMLGQKYTKFYFVTTSSGCDRKGVHEGYNLEDMPSVDELVFADGCRLDTIMEKLA